MGKIRVQKVQEEIKRTVGTILTQDVRDSNIGFVTVSKVKCSSDIRYAKIYVSIYDRDQESKEHKLKLLKRKTGLVRGILGHTVRFRHVPEIEFILDDSLDYVEKIDKLIDQVHKEEENKQNS